MELRRVRLSVLIVLADEKPRSGGDLKTVRRSERLVRHLRMGSDSSHERCLDRLEISEPSRISGEYGPAFEGESAKTGEHSVDPSPLTM